jgi:hypothetical protein
MRLCRSARIRAFFQRRKGRRGPTRLFASLFAKTALRIDILGGRGLHDYRPAAAQLDDGTSDATTVAAGVVAACAPEEHQVESALSSGESPHYAARIRADLERADLSRATEIVLLHRRETRSVPQN